MTNETYNGYSNRSTWLTVLHLDNTSKEIWDLVTEKAILADTKKQFKAYIHPILFGEQGENNSMVPLLQKEQDMDFTKINYDEVWEHFAPSLKYN